MRITQVTTELRQAGAERIVLELSKGLVERGHHVEVVSLWPMPTDSSIAPALEDAGIPIHTLNLVKNRPWKAFGLGKLLDETRPDVVHTHLFHPNLLSRLGAEKRKYRLVNTVHIAERRETRWWQFLAERVTWKRTDVLTAVSRAVQSFHASRIGASRDAIPVVYNGIAIPFSPSRDRVESLRREWGVNDCARVLGSVGRLIDQKGYDILLEMLPGLSSLVPIGERWGIVILGEGEEGERLRRLASTAPREFLVKLPGFRPDAADCIGAFDLFLMPSRFEGFGLTLAEAMAHGVPAISSRADSLPEIMALYPGGKAIDFTPQNTETIAQAIRELLESGAHIPTTPFTVDAMIQGYLDLYGVEAGGSP